MDPQLEVIVAAYNAEAYLDEALRSLLAQGPWMRIRVVDDCSTDATSSIVLRYLATGQVVYHCMRQNSGRSSTPRNVGLAQVTAPYVAFFDADDIMNPGALARALDYLSAHPRCAVITSDYRNFADSSAAPSAQTHFQTCPKLQTYLRQAQFSSICTLSGLEARRLLAQENFAITGAAVYRTATLKRLGGFDESLRNSEDFALTWRLCQEGDLAVCVEEAFRRRLHPASKSSNTARVLNGKVICREKLLAGETDALTRRLLSVSLTELLSHQAAFLMASDLGRGLAALSRGLAYGLSCGALPKEGLKALLKRLIGYRSHVG